MVFEAAFALNTPVWIMELLASSRIFPPALITPSAWIVPLFITLPASWFTALADKMTKPPGAWIIYRFSTRAFIWLGVTVKLSRLDRGPKFKVIASPLAKATVPCLAIRMPALRTSGANNAMYPPMPLLIDPSFITEPVEPFRLNVVLPFAKSASLIWWVVATIPPTFTFAPGEK